MSCGPVPDLPADRPATVEQKIRALVSHARNPAGILVGHGALSDPQAFADSLGLTVRVSASYPPDHYYLLDRDQPWPAGTDVVYEPTEAA